MFGVRFSFSCSQQSDKLLHKAVRFAKDVYQSIARATKTVLRKAVTFVKDLYQSIVGAAKALLRKAVVSDKASRRERLKQKLRRLLAHMRYERLTKHAKKYLHEKSLKQSIFKRVWKYTRASCIRFADRFAELRLILLERLNAVFNKSTSEAEESEDGLLETGDAPSDENFDEVWELAYQYAIAKDDGMSVGKAVVNKDECERECSGLEKEADDASSSIQIFVKTNNGRLKKIEVDISEKVISLKGKVCMETEIPPVDQRLTFGSKQLCDVNTLLDYNIQNESIVHMSCSLLGGSEQKREFLWRLVDCEDKDKDKAELVNEFENVTPRTTLYRWIRENTVTVTETTLKSTAAEYLLSCHSKGSEEYKNALKRLAESKYGPSKDIIMELSGTPASDPTLDTPEMVTVVTSSSPRADPTLGTLETSTFVTSAPPIVSPLFTDQQSTFAHPSIISAQPSPLHPHGNGSSETLFGSDGHLQPEVAANIISRLKDLEELSKDEKDLRDMLMKKGNRQDRREMACKSLRPKAQNQGLEWGYGDSDKSHVTTRTVYNDATDLQAVLVHLSRGCPDRGARILQTLLDSKRNEEIKATLEERLSSDNSFANVDKKLVDGIIACIEHHTPTSGTRPRHSQTLVSNLAMGCAFASINEDVIKPSVLSRRLGITRSAASKAIKSAERLHYDGEQVGPYSRKPRIDRVRDIVAPYIFNFLQDNAYSRLDSNQKPIAMEDPTTGKQENISRRIWNISTQADRYKAFIDSDYYTGFQNEFAEATIGITVFNDVVKKIGKFMTNPKQHSCVDEKISDLEHAMESMTMALSKEDVRSSAKEYSGLGLHFDELTTALRRNDYKDMVKSVCCEEHEFVDLPKNGSGNHLRLIKNSCADGSCEQCGVKKKLGILDGLEVMMTWPQ